MAQHSPASMSATRTTDYPAIAAEKYRNALERVSNVHESFQAEVEAIGLEIGRQANLAMAALERFRQVTPLLETIEGHIRSLDSGTRQVGTQVDEGKAGLEDAMAEVETAIAELRERNLAVRDILETGNKVTESVNRIAEIAIENKVIAINASVTASKASDKVKGFKVIASEVTRLSATMAERVDSIVSLAAQSAQRLKQVMRNMDDSIGSTEVALGNIGEAFSLLDHVRAAIRETEAANAAMLEANVALGAASGPLGEALGRIDKTAAGAGRKASELGEAMGGQAGAIAGLGAAAGALEVSAREIASGGGTEEPKVLRTCEAAVTSYDPALSRMLRENHYINFVGIRLLRYSSDRKLVPFLAETWSLGSDGRTWEFRLRKGARFHDGSPIGSRDVKFSLERLMNPALSSPYANLFSVIEGAEDYIAGKAASVSGIVAPSPDLVVMRLKASYNFFLSLLALSFSSVLKEDPAIFSRPITRRELLSAGPFRFDESGDPAVDRIVRNDYFLNGRPFLDAIEIRRNITDVPAALAKGEIDLAYNIPAAKSDALRQAGFRGEMRYYTSRYCYGLVVNFRRRGSMARHRELRQALAMAIDKDKIVNDILGGKALRADTVLPPEILDLGGEVPVERDVAGARRMVDRLRKSEDLSAPVKVAFRGYATIPQADRIAAEVEAAFSALGLACETSYHPQGAPIASFVEGYDLVFLGFLSELDLYSAVEPFINPEGGDNYFNYDNPSLVRELEDSITVKDSAERRARFVSIVKKLALDGFSVPLFFNKAILAVAPQVSSVFMSAEESIVPDAVFLGGEGQDSATSGRVARHRDPVARLGQKSEEVATQAAALIATGRDITRTISEQEAAIGAADGLFASFEGTALSVQATRAGIAEKMRATAQEAGKTGRATGLILGGLHELTTALAGTVRAMDQAGSDIDHMLAIVRDIGESNEFIGSIAINAAVIAAKSDSRGGDLVKVAQSIAEQARQNTANTDTIRKLLEDMGKSVRGHRAFIEERVETLSRSASRVGQAGQGLAKVGPLLDGAVAASDDIESGSARLASALNEARASVNLITGEIASLAKDAETLQFGLELEQAVTDILKDVAWMNRKVSETLAET